MPALDIIEIRLTQTLTPVVAFVDDPALLEGEEYRLLIDDSEETFRVVPFTHITQTQDGTALVNIGRAGGKIITSSPVGVSVVVMSEDGAVARQGAVISFTPQYTRDNARMISQAIYDVITAQEIVDRFGRPVNVLHNGFFEPEDLGDGEVGAMPMPFIEVKRAAQTGVTIIGSKGVMYDYEVAIDISDTEAIGAANDVTHLQQIAQRVVVAIRQGVGLQAFGIWDKKSFSFSIDTTGDVTEGDNMNTVTLTVEVSQVQSA